MPRFLQKAIPNLIFAGFRWWLLINSNRSLAFQFKLAQRVAFAITGDRFLKNVIGELAEIFEQEGKEAETARNLFRQADREYSAAIVRSFLQED